jgi:O-methyltransferase involved in polyketide biosynthesis
VQFAGLNREDRAVAAEGSSPPRANADEALEALEPVERTLLIPLLARVWAHRWHLDLGQPDQSAEQVLAHLPEGVMPWMPDPVTLCCIVWRTRQLVTQAQSHFERHPRAWGLNLGAGLSDYFQWLDNGVNGWIDTDREGVMQLRAHCMPSNTRARGLSLDVSDKQWWSRASACIKSRREPLFVMVEGVLLYLQPTQARQVLATLGEHLPAGSSLMFDVIPRWLVGWPVRWLTLREAQPVFQWGMDSVQELEAIHPRLHLQAVMEPPLGTTGWPWLANVPHPMLAPYALVRMSVS